MLHRLLTFLANLSLRFPERVIAVAALPMIALGIYASTVPTDLSFLGLMDRSNVEVDRYFTSMERLQLGGSLPLLLEGPDVALDTAIADLAPKLRVTPGVRSVVTEPPTAWLKSRAPYLVDAPIFERWLRIATHPEDAESAKQLAADLKGLGSSNLNLRAEGVRVVLVTLDTDPMAASMGGGDFAEVQIVTDKIMEAHPDATASYAGLAAIAAQDQTKTLGMVQRLTPITLLLVLLLLRLVEPSLLRLFAVAVPMLLSVGGTLGLVGLLTGTFTVLETLFGIIVFGLGIDFALHLIVRAREERGNGKSFDDAVRASLVGAGRGVVAGAITTAGAFFIVSTAPDPSALHLGLSGGIGLILCLVLMLTVLPSIWVLLARRGTDIRPQVKDGKHGVDVARFRILRVIAHHAATHPWLHVGIAVVAFGIALAGIPRFQFETDLEKVFNRDVPAVASMNRVQALFGMNSSPWYVATKTLEEARSVHQRFVDDPTFGRVESIATVLREDRQARLAKMRQASEQIRQQNAIFEGMIPLVTDEEAKQMRGGIELLAALNESIAKGPPTAAELPISIGQRLVGPGGEFVVYAYAEKPSFDGEDSNTKRLAAQAIHPDATGLGALLSVILGLDRPWTIPVFFGILLFVVVLLAFDMRRPRYIFLSLIPVVWASMMTLGVLCWFEVPMNVLMSAVVPLIIGLGVDDGIHVVHRIKEDRMLPVDVATESVGRAILMTTVTTCLSFSALMFTNHAGMEGMGLVMLIGLPLCLFASITTLPAVAVLLGVSSPSPNAVSKTD